jgi:hypothetical protein
VSTPASGLRIGDAERAAAAERLAWHFSHGRLDQPELDERLGLVMRASTADDLTGLFADLPADEPVTAAAARGQLQPQRAGRPRPARVLRRPAVAAVVLTVCIIAVLKVAVLHPVPLPIIALAVIALVAVLWRSRVRT